MTAISYSKWDNIGDTSSDEEGPPAPSPAAQSPVFTPSPGMTTCWILLPLVRALHVKPAGGAQSGAQAAEEEARREGILGVLGAQLRQREDLTYDEVCARVHAHAHARARARTHAHRASRTRTRRRPGPPEHR